MMKRERNKGKKKLLLLKKKKTLREKGRGRERKEGKRKETRHFIVHVSIVNDFWRSSFFSFFLRKERTLTNKWKPNAPDYSIKKKGIWIFYFPRRKYFRVW